MRSKRLSRQLKKTLGVEDITAETVNFDQAVEATPLPEKHVQILKQLPLFLDQIESTYEQADKMVELANRSIEISTKELSAANDSLIRLNSTVNAMINSLQEGFIVFDRDGRCTSVSSKRAADFLGSDPFGKTLWDAFKIPVEEQKLIIDWFNYLFDSRFIFEEIATIGPEKLKHDSLHISIKYKPMIKNEVLAGVIVILSDVTSEIESAKRAERFMYKAEMVTSFFADQALFMKVIEFFNKTIEDFRKVAEDSQIPVPKKADVMRSLHSLKGSAGALYMIDLAVACGEFETKIIGNWTIDDGINEIRNNLRIISDDLENALNDFFNINKDLLGSHRSLEKIDTKSISVAKIEKFCAALKLHGSAKLMDEFVDEFFMTPFVEILAPFERMAYSTAKKLKKKIDVSLHVDAAIKVFAEPYKDFFTTFVHIINNAIDHGIEDEETRLINEKNPAGVFKIEAQVLKSTTDKEKIIIKIQDDGGGIDPEKVRFKLAELGVSCDGESDTEIINHIFDVGFSTRDSVSEISGRGVGLNAVYEEVQRMGGSIAVQSLIGKGTEFCVILPYLKADSRVNINNVNQPTRIGA